MKRLLVVLGAALALAAPLPAEQSLHFSTALGSDFAWQLTRSGDDWLLSFADDAIVVDGSDPGDPALVGDLVSLPTMILSDITDQGAFLTAALTPTEELTIVSDPEGATVLTASLASDLVLVVGTTFAAYSLPGDDLDVTDHDAAYGITIPQLAAGDNAGLPFDISFTGDLPGGGNIQTLLLNGTGAVRGTLSGQMTVIPAPGAVVLSSLGLVLLGWFRIRR